MSFFSPRLTHDQNIASSSFTSSSSSFSASSSSSTLFSSISSSSVTNNAFSSSFTSHATTSASTPVTTQKSSLSSVSSIYAPITTSVSTTFAVAPSTTLVFTTAGTASIADVTTPISSTNAHNLLSSGFWNNKGAVAATFTLVALAVCTLVGGAIFVLARQRKRDRELTAAEEFFDKNDSTGTDVLREPSIAPSMAQETTHAPAEVYMSRDVHYGSNYASYGNQATYGLNYPQLTHSIDGRGNSSTYMPQQPSLFVGDAPPVSYRQPRGREPGTYQPSSIDSFYGGIE